jgi:hypothetical protein
MAGTPASALTGAIAATTGTAVARPQRVSPWRSWRTAVGLTAVVAGATIVAGAFLPWVEAFAGLLQIPGVRGGNGRILAAGGILIAVAGLAHAIRGWSPARWLIGIIGFGSLAFSGYLLMRLSGSLRSLGGDSMVIARGGPGLWVIAAGSLAAFTTLFLPSSAQTTLRRPASDGGLLTWAADLESAGARRILQISLGMVWLFDAALQYQPAMFGKSFVTGILDPAAMGSPALVANPLMLSGQLISRDPAAWNAAFATIQLLLAAGLLWRRTVRAALAGTVVWALAVWWLGEGLGGIFTGAASPITGAPGAALLYVLIAVLIWPARPGAGRAAPSEAGQTALTGSGQAGRVAAGTPLGDRVGGLGRPGRLAWLAWWAVAAVLLLQPANRAPLGLRDTFAGLAAGEPGWIASIDHAAASAVGNHGTLVSVLLALACAAIAAGLLSPATTKPALAAGMVIALVIWVIGENFGGIFTGSGTDPNTGPLLILLAVACWPRGDMSEPGRARIVRM